MDRVKAFWAKSWINKIILGVGTFVLACCVLSLVIGSLTPRRSAPQTAAAPTAAPAAQAVAVAPQPTAKPEPTAAPAPTAAPEPTSAPEPTATPEPAPTAAPSVAKIGDRVQANGIAFTVLGMTKTEKIGQFLKAKAGNTFVIAEVVIENVDAEKAPYNPFYFKVKDADGFEHNIALNTDDKALKSGDLEKGDKARGTVAFEVGKDATGLVLEYKPILFGKIDPIKVALSE